MAAMGDDGGCYVRTIWLVTLRSRAFLPSRSARERGLAMQQYDDQAMVARRAAMDGRCLNTDGRWAPSVGDGLVMVV